MRLRQIFAATLLLAAAPSQAGDLSKLVVQALMQPGTIKTGVIKGEDERNIRSQTFSMGGGEVRAAVSTIKTYDKRGCGRVRVVVDIPNVTTKDGRVVPYTTSFDMDMCVDGSAPAKIN